MRPRRGLDRPAHPRHPDPAARPVKVVISATVDPRRPTARSSTNTADASVPDRRPDPPTTRPSRRPDVDTEADLGDHQERPGDGRPPVTRVGFDYTITVHNYGPSDNSGGFTVSDTLPAGLTFAATPVATAAATASASSSPAQAPASSLGANDMFTVHVDLASTIDTGSSSTTSPRSPPPATTDPASANDTQTPSTSTVTEDVVLSRRPRPSTATPSPPAAAATFTLGHQQRSVRRRRPGQPDRRPSSRPASSSTRSTTVTSTCSPRPASRSPAAWPTSMPRTHRSITVPITSPRRPTGPGVSNSASRPPTTAGPATRHRHASTSSRTSSSASSRRSDSTPSPPAAPPDLHHRGHQRRPLRCRRRRLTDTSTGRLLVDSIAPVTSPAPPPSQSISCSLAHLAAGATKSITVTYHVALDDRQRDPASPTPPRPTPTRSPARPRAPTRSTSSRTSSSPSSRRSPMTPSTPAPAATPSPQRHQQRRLGCRQLVLTDTVDSRLVVDSLGGGFACPDGDRDPQTITCSLASLAVGCDRRRSA